MGQTNRPGRSGSSIEFNFEFEDEICESLGMRILDGKACAESRKAGLKQRIQHFQQKTGRVPHLVVVSVGHHLASEVYIRNKQKACADLGIHSSRVQLPESLEQEALHATIEKLESDPLIDGILLQLPLPAHLDAAKVFQVMSPEKDVDGFSLAAIVAPCTPQGVIHLLAHYDVSFAGKHAVVVGRSHIVGRPMAELLLEKDCTVTICHSKTKNLSELTRLGDIVIVAAGKKHLLGRGDFKSEAVVVDVGMHGSGTGELMGDVRFEEVKNSVAAVSPVPGGVGPMTIVTLLENTMTLAERNLK